MNDGQNVRIRKIIGDNMVQELQYKVGTDGQKKEDKGWGDKAPFEGTKNRVVEDLIPYNFTLTVLLQINLL